jgi:NAD(P)-dependent dehydrogenase (short-subunit alcohol dehydrogenase family)
VPDMIERRGGRIVMVASTAGELAWPSMSAYCTSKHAVMGLMRSVAQDVAPYNITCNAVLPGWVRTKMSEARAELEADKRGISVDDVWKSWAEEYPAGRVVTTEEVAGLILFLSSDASSGITGEGVTIALGLS